MKILVVLGVLFVIAVASQRVEIYDGNFYGIDEDRGIQTSDNGGESVEVGGGDGVEDPDSTPLQWGPYHGRYGGNYRGRGYHHRSPPPMCRRYQEWFNMTETQKMEIICQRLQAAEDDGVMGGGMGPGPGRGRGMMWKLQLLSDGSRQKVLDLMAQRKQSMLDCCAKTGTDEKLQCVKDMNSGRYDRICSGQEPLCPMTAYRAEMEAAAEQRGYPRRPTPPGMPLPEEMIRNTTDTCCALTGEDRATCFDAAINRRRQHMIHRMHHGGYRMGMGPGGMGGPGMGMGYHRHHGMGGHHGMHGWGRGRGRGRMGPPGSPNNAGSTDFDETQSFAGNGRRSSRRYARRQIYRGQQRVNGDRVRRQ